MHQRKHSRSTRRSSGPDGLTRSRRRTWLALLLFVVLVAAAVLFAAESSGIAPRLLAEYIQRRTSGHAPWITTTGQWVSHTLWRLDRGDALASTQLPDWAGARPRALARARGAEKVVTSANAFSAAIASARAGDTITLAPGEYRFAGPALAVVQAGTEGAPITVRSGEGGAATLEFDQLIGFQVNAPYWVFENLAIRGVCANHDNCEHAFHIVGNAHHVVIRNNTISDFNAQIKINGEGGHFPDSGSIIDNTLTQTAVRRTALPVTPIDLVAASHWTIEGNLITDFVKADGDETSYGAFAKGGGSDAKFLRNVVLCEHRLRGAPGRRIGLSLGGGGSAQEYCRDRRCIVELEDGLIAGNLIAACSDDGIYVNRSSRSRIVHNTLLDTAGIEVRFPESSADVSANLVDGPLRVRDNAILDANENVTSSLWQLYVGWHRVRGLFAGANSLDLQFVAAPPRTGVALAQRDLCGRPWSTPAAMGAFEDFAACLRTRGRRDGPSQSSDNSSARD